MIQPLASSKINHSQAGQRTKRQMLATGFASPADNFIEDRLNIHDLLVSNATATYFFKVTSASYAPHFQPNDILVIDRSKQPQQNNCLVVVIDHRFSIARMEESNSEQALFFFSDQANINEQEVTIWGVITNLIRPL